MKKMKVVQYGIGPIGLLTTQILAERPNLEIVGAIDKDPAKLGKELGLLAELSGQLGVSVTNDVKGVIAKEKPDIVVLTTTSSLEKIQPQITEILECGVSIVTTCEELSFPWLTNGKIAAEIDSKARQNKAAVLSTGINPGFVMDLLPIVATGVCRELRHLTVERIQDAQHRRIPFQNKIGAGLSAAAFRQKVREGTLRHVGLTESMHMIAHKIGWQPVRTEETIEPVLAQEEVRTGARTIAAGDVLGVEQIGRCYVQGEETITMVFRATIGEAEPRDRILIQGTPGIELTIKEGIFGDVATCAIVVNAIPAVIGATPGLHTMADISPVSYFRGC